MNYYQPVIMQPFIHRLPKNPRSLALSNKRALRECVWLTVPVVVLREADLTQLLDEGVRWCCLGCIFNGATHRGGLSINAIQKSLYPSFGASTEKPGKSSGANCIPNGDARKYNYKGSINGKSIALLTNKEVQPYRIGRKAARLWCGYHPNKPAN